MAGPIGASGRGIRRTFCSDQLRLRGKFERPRKLAERGPAAAGIAAGPSSSRLQAECRPIARDRETMREAGDYNQHNTGEQPPKVKRLRARRRDDGECGRHQTPSFSRQSHDCAQHQSGAIGSSIHAVVPIKLKGSPDIRVTTFRGFQYLPVEHALVKGYVPGGSRARYEPVASNAACLSIKQTKATRRRPASVLA